MGDVIFQILFHYPGAIVRWAIFRRKPLKEYFEEEGGTNSFVFLLFVVAVIVLVIWLTE